MKHRIAVLAAAVLWSLSGFFVKSPTLSEIEPVGDRGLLIACWRCFFAAIFLFLVLLYKRYREITSHGRDRADVDPFWPLDLIYRMERMQGLYPSFKLKGGLEGLMPLVISFAAMNLLFVAAMTRADAGDVIFLQYMAPLWVLIGGLVFLGERFVKVNGLALVFGLAGVGVIVQASMGTDEAQGAALALGAGVAYAGVILSLRYLNEERPLLLIFYSLIFSWLILLPWAAPITSKLSLEEWGWIAVMAILQMALPYVLFAWALQGITAQEAALITLVEPVLNPLWVWWMWGEEVAHHTAIGGGLIIVGLALRYGILSDKGPPIEARPPTTRAVR